MPEVLTEVEPDRGALCEECEEWEYNEDGSCRTFMVCGVCWNKQVERSRLERKVIEAAKEWATQRYQPHFGGIVALEDEIQTAVRTLIEFESSQQVKS